MRRRDYELISTALRDARPLRNSDRGKDWYTGWLSTVESLADRMQQELTSFDRVRFLHDAGVER